MNLYYWFCHAPKDHSRWMKPLSPIKRQLFNPLTACALSSLPSDKIEKVNARGEHKYFPIDIYSKRKPAQTIYIYQQALRFLDIPIKLAEKHRGKESFYHIVVKSLNKMPTHKKLALMHFAGIIQNNFEHGRAAPLLVTNSPNGFLYCRFKVTKKSVVDIFLEAFKKFPDEIWHPKNSWRVPHTARTAEVRDQLGRPYIVQVEEAFQLKVLSPPLKHLDAGEYLTAQTVHNFATARQELLLRPKLKFPQEVKINKLHNKSVEWRMNRAYQLALHIHNRKAFNPDLQGVLPVFLGSTIYFTDKQGARACRGMIVDQIFDEINTLASNQLPLSLNTILMGFRDLVVGLQNFRAANVMHTQIKPTNVFLFKNSSDLSYSFRVGGFDSAIPETTLELDLLNITGTGDQWDCLSKDDFLALMRAIVKDDKGEWCQIRYAADLASVALIILQLWMRDKRVFTVLFNAIETHEIYRTLQSAHLTEGKDVHLPLQLLDYQDTLGAYILSGNPHRTYHNRLVNLLTSCLHRNWQERPSLRAVLKEINRLIADFIAAPSSSS